MVRALLTLVLLSSCFVAVAAPVDLDSPFEKILILKNEKGEVEKKQIKDVRLASGNYEAESKDGSMFVVAQTSVAACLPVCPDKKNEVSSQAARKAIQFLENVSPELRQSAGIGPKEMVLWDQLLKMSEEREKRAAQQEKEKREADSAESKKKLNQQVKDWLEEARNYMKPRSGKELHDLKARGEALLAETSAEGDSIREYLAVLSQILPTEKGGPLPDLDKLKDVDQPVLPDEMLIWFAGGVYLISLFLLLFGLSYLSNIFTCIQSKFWGRAVLYSIFTPIFFAGLYYLWWPTQPHGQKVSPAMSNNFCELDFYLKSRLKPIYYLPKKELTFSKEEFIAGVLDKVRPTDKLIGYLKGRMGEGQLNLDEKRWSWQQGMSVLGLPLEIPLLFEGPITDGDSWENPKIDQVRLGQLRLPPFLADHLEEAMRSTFRIALQNTGLQGLGVGCQQGGAISIAVPSSGVRPVFVVSQNEEAKTNKPENRKELKKKIAAEDLMKEIQLYQGRFVLLDGYVEDVDSGGEYSGDSKATDALGGKLLADKPNGQIGLDRMDKFFLRGGLTCLIKSKAIFCTDKLRGDIYWGPRANTIQGEPLIKKGMRVRFMTEGRVEGQTIYGIRLDEASQIQCYDPQQEVKFSPLNPVQEGDADFDLKAEGQAGSDMTVTFQSSDPSIVEVYKGNRAKIKKAGRVIITATQEGNSSWLKGTSSQELVVEPKK